MFSEVALAEEMKNVNNVRKTLCALFVVLIERS